MTTEPQAGYPEQSQAVTVLVLGILSIVVCQILGPFAWKMGNDELKAITERRRSPEGQGMAQAGKICGIVGTVLLGMVVIGVLLVFLVFIPVGIVTRADFGGIGFTP
ncbi:MAG TPA: DUF4190 domain-containing protein [Acidimicrobiia bacterium]|nr:DUF4190 domain-containing protein [Acidimicrobiia bacterium]